jgi:protein-S-isoprenylcysteine O-methyltransferase Ste14
VLGLSNIVQYYLGTIVEEKGLVARFGQKYIAYQKKVPRLNPVWGIVKKLLGR